MATAVLQDAQVWLLWLIIALAGGAKLSPQPSIERVLFYGHITIGTKKPNPPAELNPTDKNTELRKSFGNNSDYQSDSDSHMYLPGVNEGVFIHKRTPAVDRLLGMKPKVECVENSMTLKLHGAGPHGFPFLVDRGIAHPISLSKIPPDCGYSVRRSWRDLSFSTPYDGCFVAQEHSVYALHLVIYGIPVRMACPSIAPKPPSVSCHNGGMTVKVESSTSVKDVQVKVNSRWESLMKVSPQCGFSVIEHPEGVIISVTYFPCIREKDGMLTFEVAAKGDFKISCPAQPSTMYARTTACPGTSSSGCSTTTLPGPPKGTLTPIQTGNPGESIKAQTPVPLATRVPPPIRPLQPSAQFNEFYLPEPKPDHFPAFPFYFFKPEFHQPDQVSPSSKPQGLEDDFQPTQSPPIEDQSENMPFHPPEPIQFPAQFPNHLFKPVFYHPDAKPDRPQPQIPSSPPLEPQLPQTPVPQTTRAPLGSVESDSTSLFSQFPALSLSQYPFYFFNKTIYLPKFKPEGVPAISEPAPSVTPQIPQRTVPQATRVTPKQPVGAQTPPGFDGPTHVLETPNHVRYQSTHCLTACTVAHPNCCELALSFHQHVHHHNHFAPTFSHIVLPAPATSDKEPSLIHQLINHSLISNVNKQVPHTVLGTPKKPPTSSTPSVQTGFHQAHLPNLPFLPSYMSIPENGHWSAVPAITPASVPLVQLPPPKHHHDGDSLTGQSYREFLDAFGLPDPESYSPGPDNPANSPESMFISTLGSRRDWVAKDHQRRGPVKYSPTYSWFHIPYPSPKPDSHTEMETSHRLSVSSVSNIGAPSAPLNGDPTLTLQVPKSTEKTVPLQWGWNPFFNSMEGQKRSIPDVSSDSPQVPSVLSKYSTLKHPEASSLTAPQKLYWHQAVPAKATPPSRYPKALYKSNALKLHSQNSLPQNSSSSPSGEYFAQPGSPKSFKEYWKPVELPHS